MFGQMQLKAAKKRTSRTFKLPRLLLCRKKTSLSTHLKHCTAKPTALILQFSAFLTAFSLLQPSPPSCRHTTGVAFPMARKGLRELRAGISHPTAPGLAGWPHTDQLCASTSSYVNRSNYISIPHSA